MKLSLTEVVWRSQRGEDTGEELQADLDLRTVAVAATTEEHNDTPVILFHLELQANLKYLQG